MSNALAILPLLDMEQLKKATNEAAMRGALKAIEEYYTSYRSPFIEAITDQLKEQQIGGIIELPDIVALINKSLSAEVDKIANSAVANSFIPLVSKILAREDKEVRFSDILQDFVDEFKYETPDPDDFSVLIKEHPVHEWLDVTINAPERNYRFTLHRHNESKKENLKKYRLLSLPYGLYDSSSRKMKLSIDNATLELPFTPDVLSDKFTAKLARLVLSDSLITIDTEYFDESMFPQPCHCH